MEASILIRLRLPLSSAVLPTLLPNARMPDHEKRALLEDLKALRGTLTSRISIGTTLGTRPHSRQNERAPMAPGPLWSRTFDLLEWTPDNHLRHTKFVGLRADKDPRSITREFAVPLG